METARLYARELREEDAPRVHALASCPEVAQYMRFSAQETMEGTRALIREYRSGGGPAFLVEEKGTGRVAAVFAFKAADEPHAYSLSHFSTPDLWERVTVRNCSSEWCGMPVMFWGRKGCMPILWRITGRLAVWWKSAAFGWCRPSISRICRVVCASISVCRMNGKEGTAVKRLSPPFSVCCLLFRAFCRTIPARLYTAAAPRISAGADPHE